MFTALCRQWQGKENERCQQNFSEFEGTGERCIEQVAPNYIHTGDEDEAEQDQCGPDTQRSVEQQPDVQPLIRGLVGETMAKPLHGSEVHASLFAHFFQCRRAVVAVRRDGFGPRCFFICCL
ncbi:hypothetical protein RUM4293_03204 [Ruegeria atlantica]|uniref:Uncharacterized protein n=1 Tax=Ruegeria atlantica TaxID=81569 RepID=A0A0P1E682_9RHOB|nr:hypothetical protein RUM4293_03204 [Ruegeria atlantica]